MPQVTQPDATTRKRGWIILGLMAVILVPTSLFVAVEPLFGRQTVVAKVTLVDTPRSCRDGSGRLHARHRSSVPAQTGWLWCGLVDSDHGAFVLPDSGVFTSGNGRREAMVDALREGCSYRITVAGYGQALAPGQPPVSHGHKTLVRLEQVGPCP
jgi:hypothetical protein